MTKHGGILVIVLGLDFYAMNSLSDGYLEIGTQLLRLCHLNSVLCKELPQID